MDFEHFRVTGYGLIPDSGRRRTAAGRRWGFGAASRS